MEFFSRVSTILYFLLSLEKEKPIIIPGKMEVIQLLWLLLKLPK